MASSDGHMRITCYPNSSNLLREDPIYCKIPTVHLINLIYMSNSDHTRVIVALIIAAVVIGSSLTFLGYQVGKSAALSDDMLGQKIEEGIEAYIVKQQESYQKAYEESQTGRKEVKKIEEDLSDDDAYLGERTAPVTIVEFSDYECPYCKSFHEETFPQLKEKYIDTGKVKFVYRDYPIASHSGAIPAAMAAECAREVGGNAKYYEMHDKLFTSEVGFEDTSLIGFAKELGLNEGLFKTCYESGKYEEEIMNDQKDAAAVGISATPTFVVNGSVIEGALPFEIFEQVIEAELAK